MTMSVGLARIINDPDASVLTRKALGALSRPDLLVEDKGLTINNDGRMALKFAQSSGLSEDENGLAVVVAEGGGLSLTEDGLAFGGGGSVDFTGNVSIGGTLTVAGATSLAALTCTTVNASGAMSGASLSTGPITCTSINVSGAVSAGSASISGGASVGGTVSSNAVSTNSISTGSATISGNANIGSATVVGNLTVLGSLITSGGGSGAITPSSIQINGGTVVTRIQSVYAYIYVNPPGSGTSDDYVSVPYADGGDTVVCNPLSLPPASLSWCAAIVGADLVSIRCMRGLTGGAGYYYFRVTIMKFG